MIIEEYDQSLFIGRFEDYKRVETLENPNGNFSYKGLRFLFDYLDDTHDEENPYKLDVISLCCDFSEYKNVEEYLKDYDSQHTTIKDITGKEKIADLNEEELNELKSFIENEINDKTTLIKFDNDLDEGFIIAQY
ncbi:hypothetical protein BMS3Abin17_00061 [archaeon BMS3Abin17]|nr:hypothetical protein BMS3Abin17_00061 [archaeon BMS3Abin17]